MRKQSVLALAAVMLFLAYIGFGQSADVFRVGDRSTIPFNQMVRDLKTVDIIYIGELHDVKEHHRLGLNIIRMLHEADTPLAIGLEMFRAENQKTLDAWTTGAIGPDRFIHSYYDNWTLPWSLYGDIFLYAREHRIPLVGLNIPDEVSAAVARSGFAALTEELRKRLPSGVTCNVDPTYRSFIKQAYAGHGGHSRKQFDHFCEAQLVWDKSMAEHLIQYRKANPGVRTVVLAGIGHAWRRGMPEHVGREHPATSRVILPIIAGQITPGNSTIVDADYLLHW